MTSCQYAAPAVEVGRAVDLDLEVRLAEPLGALPVRHLREAQPPARAVLDRLRRDDRQRPCVALDMQDLARGESRLRAGR